MRFLGLPDGHLVADLDLRRDISAVIREVRPDLVLQQSPERNFDRIYGAHPDHLAVAEATISAVYPDARNPHAHPSLLLEGLEPHSVPEVWIGGLEPTNLFVDVTDVFDAAGGGAGVARQPGGVDRRPRQVPALRAGG